MTIFIRGSKLTIPRNVSRVSPRVLQTAITGLDFPSNGDVAFGENAAFAFTGAALINRSPATYMHKYWPRQQPGYYTEFFWDTRLHAEFVGDRSYYGCHPYPLGGGNEPLDHKWEISADGVDTQSSEDVVYEQWYTHVVRVTVNGGIPRVEFWWDYDRDTSRKITVNFSAGFQVGGGANGCVYGGSPWSNAYHEENASGILRCLKQFASALSDSDIATEVAALEEEGAASAGGISSLWYSNVNPTPDDITDKSGGGHHPDWFFADGPRPTLWEG